MARRPDETLWSQVEGRKKTKLLGLEEKWKTLMVFEWRVARRSCYDALALAIQRHECSFVPSLGEAHLGASVGNAEGMANHAGQHLCYFFCSGVGAQLSHDHGTLSHASS